jgi:hypothetical protein
MDPPEGTGYGPVEPAGGTKVNPLRDLQAQVEAAYVQGRIDTDINNQIVALIGQLLPLLKLAGLAL